MSASIRRAVALCVVFSAWAIFGCRASVESKAGPAVQLTESAGSHRLPRTLAGVLIVTAPEAKRQFAPICNAAGVAWPAQRITLLAFKSERILEVWGANRTGRFHRIARYPILAASGVQGPKRRSGDMQVPEGFYRLDILNPSSRFHLSMRVSYPNDEDIAHATVPANRLGGDIYVHGNAVSAGCIAIGDAAIERVFTLVALAKPNQRRIIIAPLDLRRATAAVPRDAGWTSELYQRIRESLLEFRDR